MGAPRLFGRVTLSEKDYEMRFVVQASVGNSDGIFDAAYDFGIGSGKEAKMHATSKEIGAEVARFLSTLTPEDCKAMRYGTRRFFIELIIEPEESPGI